MPLETSWHVVVLTGPTGSAVEVYPDARDGIAVTFPHQDANFDSASTQTPWRLGKPCLDRRTANFGREAWNDEPSDMLGRLEWRLDRLLAWVDAAASGELLQNGDPLELPAFVKPDLAPSIVFDAAIASLEPLGCDWGFARTSPVAGGRHVRALVELRNPIGAPIRTAQWSAAVDPRNARTSAIWVETLSLPVLPPWQGPRTWRDLRDRLAEDGVNLGAILEDAGRRLRGKRSEDQPDAILLGFPLAERVGGVPVQRHWLAVGGLALSSRASVRRGWRKNETNDVRYDRHIPDQPRPLPWIRTENWSPDQLRRRGQASQSLREKRILLIGAGSLGSIVAEQLVRMGASAITVMDADRLEAGNLSRHALSLAELGDEKAVALTSHLNTVAPDARARALPGSFPPTTESSRLDVAGHDIVLDCTGDDDVLRAMGGFDWRGEKLFVSLAITWRAEGLVAFSASEAAFPAEDAITRFAATPAPRVNYDDANVEAIGCWNPVFPADASELHLWAALSCRFLKDAVATNNRLCRYYQLMPDGSVSRTDV